VNNAAAPILGDLMLSERDSRAVELLLDCSAAKLGAATRSYGGSDLR
jgi:hypothetical protein